MSPSIVDTNQIQQFLKVASGLTSKQGDARAKQIIHRILSDLFKTIEDLDRISPENARFARGTRRKLSHCANGISVTQMLIVS